MPGGKFTGIVAILTPSLFPLRGFSLVHPGGALALSRARVRVDGGEQRLRLPRVGFSGVCAADPRPSIPQFRAMLSFSTMGLSISLFVIARSCVG